MAKRIHVRLGKTQSKAGFAVGIIFCLIGIFVAIPIFRLFGVLWTAVAGWITYTHYKNGFTDKHIDSQVIEVEDNGEDVTYTSHTGMGAYTYESEDHTHRKGADAGEDVEERLRKLQSLYDQALTTMEEYEQKRKEILNDL